MTSPRPALAIVVELYLGGAWVDVSLDVYGRDDISITRGKSDWAESLQASRCTLTLDNTGAKYSPFNPTGPYYGLLGRNIPLRVSVEGNPRFLGEVSEWPLRADPDLHIRIEASGVLRRLSQSDSEEHSPIYRGLMKSVEPLYAPVAYWPMENVDSGSDILAADTTLGTAMTVSLSTNGIGSRSGFLGSEQLVTLEDSRIYGDVPSYTASDSMFVGALVRLPDNGVAADNTPIITINTSGGAAYWRIRANINGTWNVQVAEPITDTGGGTISTSSNSTWNTAGRAAYVGLGLEQSGSTTSWTLMVLPEYSTTWVTLTNNVARSFGRVTRVNLGAFFNAGSTAVGHVAVWRNASAASLTITYLPQLVNGWRGELAAARAERIAQEEGIVLVPKGNTAKSLPMIQQGTKSGMSLLTEAVDADGGALYEPPDFPTRVLTDGEDGTTSQFVGAASTVIANSTTQAHTGTRSLRATWGGSAADLVFTDRTFFITGYRYTFTAWVYVPTGAPAVKLRVNGVGDGAVSAVTNAWTKLTVTWTATGYTHSLRIVPNTTPTAGQLMYFDDATVAPDRAGLQFKPMRALFNQTAALTLNYAAAEIALPFEPTDDDRDLINDASVTVDGATTPARYQQTTGALSVATAGRYSTSVTRNVLTGYLAACWARWIVHQGTWWEPRFPQITVDLNRKRTLTTAAVSVDMGSVIVGTNPPAWLPPQDIKQMVTGLTETINVRTWTISFNCVPGRPFDTFQVGVSTSRLGPIDSRLSGAITSTATSISVVSTTASGRWTTNAAKFPLSIVVAGEEMTVTNITGTGLTQTFTVTRSVNGVVKAHTSGTAVWLKRRPTLSF